MKLFNGIGLSLDNSFNRFLVLSHVRFYRGEYQAFLVSKALVKGLFRNGNFLGHIVHGDTLYPKSAK